MDNSFWDELDEVMGVGLVPQDDNENIQDQNNQVANLANMMEEPDKVKTNRSEVLDDPEVDKVLEPYEKAKEKLASSKKTNIFGKAKNNSEQYLGVRGELEDLIEKIEHLNTPSNTENLISNAKTISSAIKDVINVGNKYMRKTGGYFGEGKVRKQIVASLLTQLHSDSQGLEAGIRAYDSNNQQQNFAGFSWYHFMREQSIDIGNVYYEAIENAGGEYSGVKQLDEDADTFGGALFKEDMNVYKNEDSNIHNALIMAYALSDKSEYPLTPQEKEMLNRSQTFDFSDVESKSPSIVLFKKYFNSAINFEKSGWEQANKSKLSFFQKDVNNQAYTNLNNREVAAYKIAVLLGQPSLFARAQKAVIKSQAGGEETTKTGTIVENVKGVNASEAGQAILNAEIENFKQMGIGALANYGKHYEQLYSSLSGGFIKSMLNLQVLDYICNVPERKLEDMVIKEDPENKAVSVTGINNTSAFGTGKSNNGTLEKGQLSLVFMDIDLAQSIRMITKEVLVYQLKDLISDAEISGTWERISKLQTAIQKQMDMDPSSFITSDEDWENIKIYMTEDQKVEVGNYFANYANSKMDIKSDEASKRIGMSLAKDWIVERKDLTKQKWNEQLRAVCEEGIGKKEFEDMLEKYDLMPWFSPKGIMDEKYVKDSISASLKREFIGKLATALFNCRKKSQANA